MVGWSIRNQQRQIARQIAPASEAGGGGPGCDRTIHWLPGTVVYARPQPIRPTRRQSERQTSGSIGVCRDAASQRQPIVWGQIRRRGGAKVGGRGAFPRASINLDADRGARRGLAIGGQR